MVVVVVEEEEEEEEEDIVVVDVLTCIDRKRDERVSAAVLTQGKFGMEKKEDAAGGSGSGQIVVEEGKGKEEVRRKEIEAGGGGGKNLQGGGGGGKKVLKGHGGSSCIGALYFINGRGDVLLYRKYRDDVDGSLAAGFRSLVLHHSGGAGGGSGGKDVAPVKHVGGNAMIYYRAGDVYLLALTKSNSNCMMIFQFLVKFVELVRAYCKGAFSEDVVKGNFVLMYELLDDVLDFGYPQLTDPSVTKEFIYQKGWATESMRRKKAAEAQSATLQVTGAVGWRKQGLKYKKNEMYLDVLEKVSCLMSPQGAVLRANVEGKIKMASFLSGMPEVKLGLNDALDDATFHPCVNLGRYNAERVVSFVPPDGEFDLAKYRVTEGIELPFKATALVTEQGRTRMDVTVKVRSSFEPKLFASNTVILIPTPPQTARASFQVSAGKAKYDPKRGSLVWKVKKFSGMTEHTLAANVELISTATERKPWGKPPLCLSFQIPMHSVSGVQVQYMKVWEKSGYNPDKWVRKTCLSGDYQIRL